MTALVLGLLASNLAVLLHAAVFRWLPGRVRLSALLFLSIVTFAALVLGAAIIGQSIALEDWFLAFVLSISLVVAYLLLFMGVLYDSPTLAVVNAINEFGVKGMPLSMWDAVVKRHPFVESRLAALIASGMIVDDGSMLYYRGNVHLLLRLSEGYRSACRTKSEPG